MKNENQRYAAAKAELKTVLADERRIDFKEAANTGSKVASLVFFVASIVSYFANMEAAHVARIFVVSGFYLMFALMIYLMGISDKLCYFKLIGKALALFSCLGFALGMVATKFLGAEANSLLFLMWLAFSTAAIARVIYIKYPLLKFECWQKAANKR